MNISFSEPFTFTGVDDHETVFQGRLVFVAVGQSIMDLETRLKSEGRVIANHEVIALYVRQNPQVALISGLVVADPSFVKHVPHARLSYVYAHGRCERTPKGFFWNGMIDYAVPIHESAQGQVAILELL